MVREYGACQRKKTSRCVVRGKSVECGDGANAEIASIV